MSLKFNREAYEQVFTDLEKFKDFCSKTSWVTGYGRSYRFDERDLYNNKIEAWRTYVLFTQGKKPKYKPNKKKMYRRT